MANLSVTRFNQTVGSTDPLELITNLSIRGGILANLDEHTFVSGTIMSESIPKGSIHKEYHRYGNIGSEYHEIGERAMAMGSKRQKRRIFLDDRPRLTKDSVDDIDVFLSDIPHQTQIAARMGVELANHMEEAAIRLTVLASREAAEDEFLGGGIDNNGTAAVLAGTAATATQQATALLTKLDEIDQHWFDINMNESERHVLINPAVWYALRDLDEVYPAQLPFAHPYAQDTANLGPTELATLDATLVYKGFKIMRSQLTKNVFGRNLISDKYRAGDFSATVGVVYTPMCAALIRSQDIKFESYREPEALVDSLQATMLLGGGTIYPEKSIELILED